MSRAHYWQYMQNSEGQPIKDVQIRVYEAGTNTPAYVYSSETGGTATNVIEPTGHTTTDANGFFEFWVGDNLETNGYASNVKFKIAWALPGVITADDIDNVDIIIPLSKAGKFTKTVSATTDLKPGVNAYLGLYGYSVLHNLSSSYPVVAAYQDVGGNVQSVPVTAAYVDEDNTNIYVESNAQTYVTLVG